MPKRGKKKGHARRLARRYGRSAIPMKVHGQLFVEPETVAEAVAEAQAEIGEAEVPAQLALYEGAHAPMYEEMAPVGLRSEELGAVLGPSPVEVAEFAHSRRGHYR
jgi:hypothetical protein